MKIFCPTCGQPYDVEKQGKYKCLVCESDFDFMPEPEPEPEKLTPITITITEPEPIANCCPFCKLEIPAGAQKCGHCGEWVSGKTPVNRTIYLLLSFLFGHFGVHEFYAGNTLAGTVYALVSFVGICVSAFHPAGLAIVGILGILQFILAILSNVGEHGPQKPKKPMTKGTKIFWWVIYILLFLIFLSFFCHEFIGEILSSY